MATAALVRLDRMAHPRSVAIAWWGVTLLALYLLGHALWQPVWPYKTTRTETGQLFWLVAIALPGLFATVFGQQVYLTNDALLIRLGYLGLFSKRLPLSQIQRIVPVEADSMADFSRKETGGQGRGMTCYYTTGRLGVEVITARKRYFISCRDPQAVTDAVLSRQR